MGVEKYGKGKWLKISENFVVTRTHTQVASHAQKYFKGLNSTKEKKERSWSSIHDVTYVENGEISAPQGPITGKASNSTAISAGQSATQTPQAPSAGTRTLNNPPAPPARVYAPRQAPHAGMYVLTPPAGTITSNNPPALPVRMYVAAPPFGTRNLDDPPTPHAGVGVYAARRIGQPIGGRVGTPGVPTAPGHMVYGLGPVSWTNMSGVPMNLGPMTFPMQNRYAHL